MGQHKNIGKLIELYANGNAPAGQKIYILKEEVVEFAEAMSSPGFVLAEIYHGHFHQFVNESAYHLYIFISFI